MKVTQKKKFMVGLFMASGIILAIVIFFWLGVTSFLEQGKHYATYFDQSVQGLAVDSPVKFRGVTIGQVTKINVAPDGRLVEVILILNQDVDLPPEAYAQLTVVGITGVMYIEIDVAPGKKQPPPKLTFKPPYPVIPSQPSSISQFMSEVDRLLSKLSTLDVQNLSRQLGEGMQSFEQTMEAVRQAVEQLRLEKSTTALQDAIESLNRDLSKIGTILDQTGSMVDRSAPQLQAGLADFQDSMANLQKLTKEATRLPEITGEYLAGLSEQLSGISSNLEQTIDNLNRLLERLADQPSQLLFGKPPPSKLEEKLKEK